MHVSHLIHYFTGIFILVLSMGFGRPAVAQTIDEDLIRKELKGRNIDEGELTSRLEEKGIDTQSLSEKTPEELLELKGVVEETIKEMEAENEGQHTSAEEHPMIQQDSIPPAPKDAVPLTPAVTTPGKDKQKDEIPIYGKSVFEGSIPLFERTDDANVPPSYILGAGDKLTVSIWGIAQYNSSFEINHQGYIQPERMPRIYLKGLTLDQAKEILRGKFKKYYPFNKNEFETSLNHIRSITVHIYGEVNRPGGFNIPATNTALNAIVAAGGPSKLGSIRKITLLRGKTKTMIDVYRWLEDPSYAEKLYLRENDILLVPVADRIVRITGAVYRPMRYEMVDGEHLSDLLSYAGGLRPDAYRENINIIRYEDGKKRIKSIPWSKFQRQHKEVLLLPGDIVEVRSINLENRDLVEVEGAVQYPGNYAWTPTTKLMDILPKARLSKSAKMDLAYVIRTLPDSSYEMIKINLNKAMTDPQSNDNITLQAKDKIQILDLTKLTPEQTIEVSGAVYKPGILPYDKTKSMRVSDAILLSDGLKDDAFQWAFILRKDPKNINNTSSIRINLIQAMQNPGGPENINLKPFDHIVVESQKKYQSMKYYSLDGAVKTPGKYLYHEGMTIQDAVLVAGGLTPDADDSKIDIFRVSTGKNGSTTRAITTSLMGGKQQSGTIMPDDRIVIRRLPNYQKQRMVYVAGEVKYPGYYALTQPNERLASLIEKAGGLTPAAFPEGAQLYRKKDSLGFVVVRLNEALQRKRSRHNIVLSEGDQITIPKLKDLVTITGATNASELYFGGNEKKESKVSVPYIKGKNAKYYIDAYAAGIAKSGDRNKITVIHPNGRVEHTKNYLFFHRYPKVRNGSVIHVGRKVAKKKHGKKETKKFDWEKVADNTLRQVTTILSLVILAKSASSL